MIDGKEDELDWLEAEALLAALPGFTNGKLNHLSGESNIFEDESPWRTVSAYVGLSHRRVDLMRP